jgi:pimeloyl-ACP methyl ester carboxylesterase
MFVSLDTRDGLKQNIFIQTPDVKKIKGTIILFVGGHGDIQLSKEGMGWGKANFVTRTRGYWHDAGYETVIVDAPSDRQYADAMHFGHRNSIEHYQDVLNVIKYIDKGQPIWLSGTSRGSESVAYLATKIQDKIDGIILTSSITVSTQKGESILTLDLDKITVPTFIASHKNDGCWVTPPRDLDRLGVLLSNVKVLEKKVYVGGYEQVNNSCKAKTYHGFLGIEGDVLSDMLKFVQRNSHK